MHITVPKNKTNVVSLVDLSGSCGKNGVMISSLDGNGSVYISDDRNALNGATDINGNAATGFLLKQLSTPTNVPSAIILAPFAGALYAINVGASDSVLDVLIIPLE